MMSETHSQLDVPSVPLFVISCQRAIHPRLTVNLACPRNQGIWNPSEAYRLREAKRVICEGGGAAITCRLFGFDPWARLGKGWRGVESRLTLVFKNKIKHNNTPLPYRSEHTTETMGEGGDSGEAGGISERLRHLTPHATS